MKKLLMGILLSLFAVFHCTGQERGYMLDVAAQAGPVLGGSDSFYAQRFTLSPGYSFSGKWYAALPLSSACELSKTGNVKSYETFYEVGLAAGCNIFKGRSVITLNAAVGTTLAAEINKSLYYDVCARCGTAARFKPLVGLGIRYCQAIGKGGKDRFGFYASIGFRFN